AVVLGVRARLLDARLRAGRRGGRSALARTRDPAARLLAVPRRLARDRTCGVAAPGPPATAEAAEAVVRGAPRGRAARRRVRAPRPRHVGAEQLGLDALPPRARRGVARAAASRLLPDEQRDRERLPAERGAARAVDRDVPRRRRGGRAAAAP